MFPVRRIGLIELQTGRKPLPQGLILDQRKGLFLSADSLCELPPFSVSGSERIE
jgi:hypothetical protein